METYNTYNYKGKILNIDDINELLEENEELQKIKQRYEMCSQFKLAGPNGEIDPYNAIALKIPHPDNPIRVFGINDTEKIKYVWGICSSSRREWMNKEGQYHLPTEPETTIKYRGKEPELVKHNIPFFETLDEMFEVYEKFWNERLDTDKRVEKILSNMNPYGEVK